MSLARLLFTPELLAHLIRGRFEVVENAIPEDAQLRGVAYDAERGAVSLMLEHPSFPACEPGEVMAILPSPMIRAITTQDDK